MTLAPKRANPPSLCIARNGFRAEITRSKSAIGLIYHYVIMREDSPEILGWGQERSLKDARDCVRDYIESKLLRCETGS